jgi:iron-sulfur cluster assembly protein
VLTITPNAADAIERILAAPGVPEGAGLRIAPASSMDDGNAPTDLQMTMAEEPAVTDEVIEEAGARVFVENAVAGALADRELDADVADEQIHFTLGLQA